MREFIAFKLNLSDISNYEGTSSSSSNQDTLEYKPE